MGLTRQIFKHTAIYSVATVLGRLISFIMLPFYAHIFKAEGYGVIGMVDASLGLLSILFASGFHVAILKIYHDESEHNKKLVISTSIRLVWYLSLTIVVLPAVFCSPLSRLFLGSDEYSLILLLALVTFVIDVAGQSASTFLVIEQKSILYSAVGLVRLFIGLALNIYLVLILKVGVIGVFISSLVSAVVSSAIFHYAAIRAHGFVWDAAAAKKLLKFQAPLMPGEFVSYVSRQSDKFLVKFIIDIKAVGVLEMAYKFPPLMNLFVTFPFMRAWRSKSFEIAGQKEAPGIIGKMFTNYFFLMVFVGMLIAVSIDDVLKITTPPEFWAAARITKLEVITTIMAGVNSYVIFGMIYREKTTEISIIKSILAVFKILLGIILVSSFKLYGAAISSLILEIVLFSVFFYKSQKYYKVNYEYGKLLAMTFYCAGIYLLVDSNTTDGWYYADVAKNYFEWFLKNIVSSVPDWLIDNNKLSRIFLTKSNYIASLAFSFMISCIFMTAMLLFLWKENNKKIATSFNN